MERQRLYYIDNLRIFLIALVVLHHLSITYGAPGGWYYNESQAGVPAIIPLSMFVAGNQSFFMGMFFFISAFFVVPSLQRKGSRVFLKDRLIRLGIPTLVFYFFLSPLTVYLRLKFIDGEQHSFLQVLSKGWGMGFGPMWFAEALMLFTLLYLPFRTGLGKIKLAFPGTLTILLAAFLVGLGQFIIRIKLPVGSSHAFTNFQWPFFLQYIFLFPLGIIAYQNKWLDALSFKKGRQWFVFAQALIFIGFPALFVLGKAPENGIEKFMGGFTWQCFAYSIWEQVLGFSLILGLFGLSKKRLNRQGSLAKKLSNSAYGVYVLHAPILVGISALFVQVKIPQLLKFIVLAPLALLACFLLAWLLRQIPGIKKVV